MADVILKAVVVGALLPMPKFVDPPFSPAKQAGAALRAAEKLTVAIVPVVAVPPTMQRERPATGTWVYDEQAFR